MEKLSNDDLISRNDVLRVFYNKEPIVQGEHDGMGMLAHGLWRHIREAVESIPPVEAEPVVHAHWIPRHRRVNNWVECSKCNTVGSPFWKRCPLCEAKMDEEVSK